MSSFSGMAFPPASDAAFATVAASSDLEQYVKTEVIPRWAKLMIMLWPSPRLPPVIMAILSVFITRLLLVQ